MSFGISTFLSVKNARLTAVTQQPSVEQPIRTQIATSQLINGSISSGGGSLANLTLESIPGLSGSLTTFSGSLTTFSGSLTTFSGSITTFSGSITTFSESLTTLSESLTTLSNVSSGLSLNFTSLSGSFTTLSQDFDQVTSDFGLLENAFTNLTNDFTDLGNIVTDLEENVTSIANVAQNASNAAFAASEAAGGAQSSAGLAAASAASAALAAASVSVFLPIAVRFAPQAIQTVSSAVSDAFGLRFNASNQYYRNLSLLVFDHSFETTYQNQTLLRGPQTSNDSSGLFQAPNVTLPFEYAVSSFTSENVDSALTAQGMGNFSAPSPQQTQFDSMEKGVLQVSQNCLVDAGFRAQWHLNSTMTSGAVLETGVWLRGPTKNRFVPFEHRLAPSQPTTEMLIGGSKQIQIVDTTASEYSPTSQFFSTLPVDVIPYVRQLSVTTQQASSSFLFANGTNQVFEFSLSGIKL